MLPQNTRRGKTNYVFAVNGIGVIQGAGDEEFFRPIFDPEAEIRGARGAIKWRVLTEIGRAAQELGEEAALKLAREIVGCIIQDNLTSRQAEIHLRQWRMWVKAGAN
jgi:hypothetical protein